jgi:DNA-directed RNA polymerase subunit RPC12/RpoP
MTCNDATQAHIVQGALENEGIPSMLQNENMSSIYPTCVSTLSGVDLLVYEKDREAALRLLEENGMIGVTLIYCPHCGSEHIRLVYKRGKRCKALLLTIGAMLCGVSIGSAQAYWEYVCDSCRTHFERPVGRKKESNEEA